MPEANDFKAESSDGQLQRIIAEATQKAKAKNARLQRLKERNQLYLAEQIGEEEDLDEERTKEL